LQIKQTREEESAYDAQIYRYVHPFATSSIVIVVLVFVLSMYFVVFCLPCTSFRYQSSPSLLRQNVTFFLNNRLITHSMERVQQS
jgi:membrane protein YdbS with pleckstrin-like domain